MTRRRIRLVLGTALVVGGAKALRELAVAKNRSRAPHILDPDPNSPRPATTAVS